MPTTTSLLWLHLILCQNYEPLMHFWISAVTDCYGSGYSHNPGFQTFSWRFLEDRNYSVVILKNIWIKPLLCVSSYCRCYYCCSNEDRISTLCFVCSIDIVIRKLRIACAMCVTSSRRSCHCVKISVWPKLNQIVSYWWFGHHNCHYVVLIEHSYFLVSHFYFVRVYVYIIYLQQGLSFVIFFLHLPYSKDCSVVM